MKVHYREVGDGAEIVRCFGTDPHVVLPGQIGGRPVVRAAAYTFSERKAQEESNALVYETEDNRMFRDEERLLAGDFVESIVLPDTMQAVGRYIFYGCRNLKSLRFSGNLSDLGSGAFTGCRSLEKLTVAVDREGRSCVSEILGDLWQRFDVVFLSEKEEARLVFPEHYEEAVENTPARILFTQHHGSGNNYRQCFYNKVIDYRKYDELFSVARVHDRVSVLADLVFGRLLYPAGLTRSAEQMYEEFIRERLTEVAVYAADTGNMEMLSEISRRALWTREALDSAAEHAAGRGTSEVLSRLMNEKHRLFPEKVSRYEL